MPRLYVYKCRDDPLTEFSAFGNWDEVFDNPGPVRWGGAWVTKNPESLRIFEEELTEGDYILAWQTDRHCAIGIAEVVGFQKLGETTHVVLNLDPPIGDLWGTERSDRQGDEANVVAWSAFIGRRGVLDQAFVKFTSVVSAVQRSSAVRRPREVGLHGDRGQGAQKVEGAIECVRPRPLERRS